VQKFIARHRSDVVGVLRGFDRVRFRGTIRLIASVSGMRSWLSYLGVLHKDFGAFAEEITETLKKAAKSVAEEASRPLLYLGRSSQNKEAIAREIAARDGITEGLVCIVTSLEMGMGFDMRRNREGKRLELVCRPRPCLHIYQYRIHPQVGWMNAGLQTWLPLTIKVCINGRRWLARQLDRAGVPYVQCDNCIVRVDDMERAQALLDEQLRTSWEPLLNGIAAELSPAHHSLFASFPLEYYWSADETEWATDVLFRSPDALQALYPGLIRHAMGAMGSLDVMRFLADRPLPRIHPLFEGEVVTDLKSRPEGIRVKHRIGENTVKMYDKQRFALRVETTVNNARGIKVYRTPEGKPEAEMKWQRLRKGVSDLHRRTEVSDRANARYLDALAEADTDQPLGELAASICRPADLGGRRVRALNPIEPDDRRLLQAVNRGEFVLNGFRNGDVRTLLYDEPAADEIEEKRRSAAVSRKLRLLRAHGLIQKVPKSHRYHLTTRGRTIISAILDANAATPARLRAAA
jgi:hypothetical protein